jgi:hypothetical protein
MSNIISEIKVALIGDQPIPRDKVLRWIEAANDLSALSALYKLTGEGYYRIQPELGSESTCGLILRYLLQCIREDVPDDPDIEGRYEAAQTLHVWFRQLVEKNDMSAVLSSAARAVTELFLNSKEDVRDAIETGFLEHALETAALRPYFEHWSSDSRLQPAWGRALEWGKAHPDYTWGLFQQLRNIKEE